MAREARKESGTKIYHIVNRGIERRSIFAEKRERTRMINIIRENWKKYQVNFYAYCIMPNHFHMLVQADLKALALFIAVISEDTHCIIIISIKDPDMYFRIDTAVNVWRMKHIFGTV